MNSLMANLTEANHHLSVPMHLNWNGMVHFSTLGEGMLLGLPREEEDAVLDILLLLPPATNKKPGVLYSKDTIWHGPFLHLG